MTRLIGCVLALLLPLGAVADSLRVVTDDNYPPYLFRDANGQVQGYLVDLWALWEDRTGVKVELTATSWGEAQRRVLAGEADVIDMIYRTPGREPDYAFSAPYARLPVAIYTHEMITGLRDAAGLDGFRVGVQEGDACIEKLAEAGIKGMQAFSNYADLIAAALADEVKVFCMDEYPANFYLNRRAEGRRIHKAFELYSGEFHRAVRKNDTATLARVEQGMALISAEEKAALRERWMGQRVVPHADWRVVWVPLLGLLTVLALMYAWVRSLRRAVASKTAELREESQRLQDVIDGTRAGTWTWNVASGALRVSERWAEILGYRPEELAPVDIGTWRRLSHPEDRLAQLDALVAGGVADGPRFIEFTARMRHRDRHWIWAHVQGKVSRSEAGTVELGGIMLDISDSIRTKQLLEESELRFLATFEQAAVGIALVSPEGRWLRANRKIAAILGYAEDELLASTFAAVTCPEDLDADLSQVARMLAGEIDTYTIEKRYIHKDGRLVWASLTVSLVWRSDGAPDYFIAVIEDIQRRKENERALHQSQQRLRLSLDAAKAGTWEWEPETNRNHWSDEVFRLYGLMPGQGEPSYDAWLDAMRPDDRRAVAGAMSVAIEAADAFEIEWQVEGASGQVRWLMARAVPQFGSKGRLERYLGIVMDITERKRTELALRELTDELEARVQRRTAELEGVNRALVRREEETRCLLDSLVDGVVQIDHRGTICAANPAVTRILGYPHEMLIGQNVSLLAPEPHHSAHDGYLERYLRGGAPRIIGSGREVLGQHRDGQTVPLELAVSESQVRGERFFIGILRDISARKKAAAERDRVAALLDNVLNSASEESIIATDRDGIITLFNPGAERMLGYRADEMLGKQSPAIIHVPEEVAARGAVLSAELGVPVSGFRVFVEKAERDGFERREWSYVRKDGSRIPVSLAVTMMRDAEGAVTGYLGIAEDISAHKRIMAELQLARQTAEAANRAKSDFLATMSHEVRTPMNGIVGAVEVLARASLTPYQAELAEIINESALNLLTIIDDILDFSKIEAGRVELEREPVALGALIENVCVALQPTAAANGVRLSVFADPRLPARFLADPVRVRQILNNLVSNAIKFVQHQGRPGVVKVRFEPGDPSGIRLTVCDNGVGMSPDVIARLFVPFMQGDVTTTRRFGGTGLGLSICRRLVDLMGGAIRVESEPGAGSVFTVVLPLEAHPAGASPDAATPDLAGLEVGLVTADDQDGRDWGAHLRAAGASVIMFPDRESALREAAAASRRLSVLVLDEGPEAAGGLRAPDGQAAGVVWIGGSDQRAPYRRDDGLVHIGGVVTRLGLCRAVAIAAGRGGVESMSDEGRKVAEMRAPPSFEEAIQQGRLILVAEDNDTNRKVIRRQLAVLGYLAEIAQDGREALELSRTGRHALLLTDLEMPDMDGFALTAAIRQEKHGHRHFPVIALTANAVHGESARCIDAGMDDYLSKPVSLARLRAMLEKWLGAAAIDASALRELAGDDAATIADFLTSFRQSAQTAAAEIGVGLAAQDWQALARAAHRLKPAAQVVGAVALGELCARLEQVAKSSEPATIQRLAEKLIAELTAVVALPNDKWMQ